jgi:hypothetical protein
VLRTLITPQNRGHFTYPVLTFKLIIYEIKVWYSISNSMQNEGNYAKVKRVPTQPTPLGVKKLAKFIRRGIWELYKNGQINILNNDIARWLCC